MYVRCVANSNWKLWTTEKRQHRFGITGNVACVPIHAFALHSDTRFFSVKFCTFVQNKRESSLFFIDNIRNVTWPFPSAFIFPAAWRVFVRKHWKVCCSLLQWCDVGTVVWRRTCTVRFFKSLLRLFSSFPPIWVREMKVLWKMASSRAEDLKPVFYT